MKKIATPTLEDVAREAGVSTATVSRSLNLPAQVSETTRTRVIQAVEAMGYSPNFGAKVMAAKRTFTIGAVIPTMENAIFARGLQVFQEELQAQNYMLLVASSAYSAENEEDQVRALVARGVDGLLLIGHDRAPGLMRFLQQQGVPTLAAWAYDPDAVLPSIGFDNRAAMTLMVRHIIEKGHRRLAMISAHTAQNDRARGRVEGAWDAMRQAGLDTSDLRLIETDYDIQAAGSAFEQLLNSTPAPSAVICGSDVLAVGAVRKAREMGLDVPSDISITGFDDMELAQIIRPELTTIRVPHARMGRRAAEQLLSLVAGQEITKGEELEVRLIERDSLAAPQNLSGSRLAGA